MEEIAELKSKIKVVEDQIQAVEDQIEAKDRNEEELKEVVKVSSGRDLDYVREVMVLLLKEKQALREEEKALREEEKALREEQARKESTSLGVFLCTSRFLTLSFGVVRQPIHSSMHAVCWLSQSRELIQMSCNFQEGLFSKFLGDTVNGQELCLDQTVTNGSQIHEIKPASGEYFGFSQVLDGSHHCLEVSIAMQIKTM